MSDEIKEQENVDLLIADILNRIGTVKSQKIDIEHNKQIIREAILQNQNIYHKSPVIEGYDIQPTYKSGVDGYDVKPINQLETRIDHYDIIASDYVILNQEEVVPEYELEKIEKISDLEKIYTEVKVKKVDSENNNDLDEDEQNFIQATIDDIRKKEELNGFKNTGRYFYNGKQIYPKVKFQDISNKLESMEKVEIKKKEAPIVETPQKPNINKTGLTENEIKKLIDPSSFKVDETEKYVEYMTEKSIGKYDLSDFVQVEWDHELLNLNAKIYGSIREKKDFLKKREAVEKTGIEIVEKNIENFEKFPEPVKGSLFKDDSIRYSDKSIAETFNIENDNTNKKANKKSADKKQEKQSLFKRIKAKFSRKSKVAPPKNNK